MLRNSSEESKTKLMDCGIGSVAARKPTATSKGIVAKEHAYQDSPIQISFLIPLSIIVFRVS